MQTESQYIQCKRALRLKTEQVEISKVELKDIKEILKLKEEIEERRSDEPNNGNAWKTKTKVNQRRTSSMNSKIQMRTMQL